MPIWSVATVREQPSLTLVRWEVFRVVETDNYHLCGWCVENGEGRVSTAIDVLDRERMVARTHSGRTYELRGESTPDQDAHWMLSHVAPDVEFVPIDSVV
jgi:hypothetical protein